MDKKVIRTYLMREVIRLGFLPSSTKDKKTWLYLYGKSLKGFWCVEAYPPSPKMKGNTLFATIDSSDMVNLTFEYAIENIDKFEVRLLHFPDKHLMWKHDMDDRDGKYHYLSHQCCLGEFKDRNAVKKEMKQNDIESVIDTLFIHPTPHQHIESPRYNHDIRIGGGITNPFLYLFHLRIQLCPIPDTRSKERQRLFDLFENAIKRNTNLQIADLMGKF